MFIATLLRAFRHLKALLQAARRNRHRRQTSAEIAALSAHLRDDIGVTKLRADT
ncbi:DUF1127 domain-containing protein [Rhizobium sp. CG5]|uniref:DUF1127 domain-containing protein n=1 Tax=Rhizobium sp. CG5 TaxID=2726076 RepID=UPI0020346727|nr:DUF1127 domain-containing protein [Rhizobium sp. CG5]MCM2474681.1 DUF1127 domain-containing protein [Rhizobium sp. CG5]